MTYDGMQLGRDEKFIVCEREERGGAANAQKGWGGMRECEEERGGVVK